jgi:hypothetical protein
VYVDSGGLSESWPAFVSSKLPDAIVEARRNWTFEDWANYVRQRVVADRDPALFELEASEAPNESRPTETAVAEESASSDLPEGVSVLTSPVEGRTGSDDKNDDVAMGSVSDAPDEGPRE